MSAAPLGRHLTDAVTRRQIFEAAHRVARKTTFPPDYETAFAAAQAYVQAVAGAIAAIVRERGLTYASIAAD